MTERTYRTLYDEASVALEAGCTVIADAVFASPQERAAIRAVAARLGVPFAGLWLHAPAAVLEARVQGRQGDVSDAGVAVLRMQLGYDLGEIDWARVDSSGPPEATLAAAARSLARARNWSQLTA